MTDTQLKERMTYLFEKICNTESLNKDELKQIFVEAINLGMKYQHYKDVELMTKNFSKYI